MKRLMIFILLFFLISCGSIEFVYKDSKNIINPLYQKTKVTTTGVDLVFINSYLPMFFGDNKDSLYDLLINIEENKTNRSVKSNQASTNIRYELSFLYNLSSIENNCIIYSKRVVSYFSIIPKSSGYNFGTDTSLEKKYELAIVENLNQFLSFLSIVDMNSCE